MEIYLDNSATTKIRKEVLDEIISVHTKCYGNPSSLHRMGLEAEKKIENTRKVISKFLNAKPEEIYFTGGGTESNNIAILGHLNTNKGDGNIITTQIEHPSVYNVYKKLENDNIKVNYVDVDNYGFINIEKLKNYLNENTLLVSLIMVNNEIGSIQDINNIVNIIKSVNPKTKIHIDGIQAFGKIPIDLKQFGVDSFSFSSHKIHGPKGVGGLYIKSNSRIAPINYGGNQEKGIRSGTENTPGIVGFGKAVELISDNFEQENLKLNNLKKELSYKIKKEIDDIKINSLLDKKGAPHILSISFKDVKGEVLVHYLEECGIYVSTGSACSSKGKNISRTLKSIGLDQDYVEGTIRYSFGFFNKIEEIDYVVEKTKESVEDIRNIIKR